MVLDLTKEETENLVAKLNYAKRLMDGHIDQAIHELQNSPARKDILLMELERALDKLDPIWNEVDNMKDIPYKPKKTKRVR